MEDLPLFVTSIIEKLQERTGKYIQSCTEQYLDLLSFYHWPGNLRELENVIEYSMNIESKSFLTENSLPPYILDNRLLHHKEEQGSELHEAEREVIIRKLQHYGNNYSGKKLAAKALGISIRTLYRRIEKLQIQF